MARPKGSLSKVTRKELFYSKVAKPNKNGCLNWTGARHKYGYGRILVNGKSIMAHRFSYAFHNNVTLTPTQCVLHICDNPKCVAPYHLRIGDRADNNKDRDSRKRHISFKGTKNHFHKLTTKQVKGIKKFFREKFKKGMIKEMAKKYKVSSQCIKEIKQGITWKHVT